MYKNADFMNIAISEAIEGAIETEPCTESLNHRLELYVGGGIGRITLSAWVEGTTHIRTVTTRPVHDEEDQRLLERQAEKLAGWYNTLTVLHTRW